ncbi:MAG: glycosyltransferase, partial [Candidatus Sumerlaeaceae bacterium]
MAREPETIGMPDLDVGSGPAKGCPHQRWTILCLSHLALDFTLFQRPQQLMQQFAARGHEVFYAGCLGWKQAMRQWLRGQGCGVFRDVLYVTHPYSPFGGALRSLSAVHLKRWGKRKLHAKSGQHHGELRIVWLYHPDFAAIADELAPDLVVYDVMDRFRSFRASPADLWEVECIAYERADLIFAGGHSLAKAAQQDLERLGICKAVHCYPSGVDLPHFEQALAPETKIAHELMALAHPIVGYFGAVDERLDLGLVAEAARLQPSWSFVLIGPILGEVPSMPHNVHFFGARPYADLPQYLKGFDVCLLPFRQSELVAHVSPTKTPEYLAGGKPVISTPIPDVVRDYGDVLAIVENAQELVAA